MPDFTIRSDSVDVEQIMEQIRARIREKRGVDYTEQQIRELAKVKLEKFLDPRSVRSDLLEQFRRAQAPYPAPVVPSYTFEDTTMFETHRGPLRFIRKLLAPILKLFFNPNALTHALHTQAEINKVTLEREVSRENQRRDLDALYFEVIHNLVFELTRTGIEVKNLKMRVESLASRVEFNERRARALESVVAYKPEQGTRQAGGRGAAAPQPAAGPSTVAVAEPEHDGEEATATTEGPGQRSRRRRRRRGRRGGGSAQSVFGPSTGSSQPAAAVGDAEPAGEIAAREDDHPAEDTAAGEHESSGHDDHRNEVEVPDETRGRDERTSGHRTSEPPAGDGSSGSESQ